MVGVKSFGSVNGKRVDQFTLTSTTGVEVGILNWGVVVRDWRVPVKTGGKRSVVLGLNSIEDYVQHSPHFGALAGRVANRIAGASFSLGDKTYTLPANNGPNSLHGGPEGIGRQVWEAEPDDGQSLIRLMLYSNDFDIEGLVASSNLGHGQNGGPEGIGRQVWEAEPDDATNSVVFSLTSPDGHSGYPGTVRMKATYRLDGNKLRLEFGATTDRPTPLSLVQHQYFNLGTGDDVIDHTYWVRASAYTETDAALIPTGNILEVRDGGERDFRTPRKMRDAAGKALDYDGNFVLDAGRDVADPIAIVNSPDGDLTLRLWSDRPGLQFYNAVTTNVPVPGLNGKHYGVHSGFCLEDQAFPDALHHPHFPNIIITPDKPYAHWCEFEIA